MRPIGFSTGAIAKSDYRTALKRLRACKVRGVELSALRLAELKPLVDSLAQLDLSDFDFVSFHAPSRFQSSDEQFVVDSLRDVFEAGIPIIVHPDVMYNCAYWKVFGSLLLIENMDKRRPVGKTARDLSCIFQEFGAARLCFDVGHARQVDPTMMEARRILECCSERIAQVHISEVNTSSRHEPLSEYAIKAFQSVANLIPEQTPIILETMIDKGQSDIAKEVNQAMRALSIHSSERVALAG